MSSGSPGEQDRATCSDAERLQALRRYGVLKHPPQERLGRLTHLAAAVFGVPAALVAFAGEGADQIVSSIGLARREAPRGTFCPPSGARPQGVTVVPDAGEDERFSALAEDGTPLRFYAGAPLVAPEGGACIGTVGVMDTAPRDFDETDAERLRDVAAAVMDVLEQHRQAAARQREQALQERLNLEKTVARISRHLLSGAADLQTVIDLLGEAVEADRAYLFQMDGAQNTFSNTHEWNAPGMAPALSDKQNLRVDAFSWWWEQIQQREALPIIVSELPPEARTERRFFEKQGYKTVLDVPIRLSDGTFHGFIGFDTERDVREWSEEDVRLLRLVSDLLAGHFERERARHAVRESEQRFRSVVENARDIIFQTNAEGEWTLLSPSWEEVTGYTVRESLGTPFTAYLHPSQQREEISAYRERMVGQGNAAEDQFCYQTKSGDPRWLRVSARLLRDDRGEITGTTGTLTDVTDVKRFEAEREARERAEELLEAKTSFLNNMSHELRTPLASILGFADVLAEEVEGEQREFATRIAANGKRLRQTLESVLDLARLENRSAANLNLTAVDVVEAVREAAGAHRPAAQEKGLFLNVTVPEPKDHLRAPLDGGALWRILDNLLSNAIKFTEEGGITVSVQPGPHGVRLRVADTGIGIGKDFQRKLFDDFTQESKGLDRTHEGAGLGLAIVQHLTELMDGTVEVASNRGEGTTFTLEFPRLATAEAPGGQAASTGEAPAPLPPATPGVSLLVVEDNPNTRALAEHLLRPRYEVASDGGSDALSLAESTRFDLFLIDINLGPHESGPQLLRRLRASPAGAHVPAVAFTAHAMPGDEERFREAGFANYLSKPFTKRELFEVIEQTLAAHSA